VAPQAKAPATAQGLKVVTAGLAEMVKNSAALDINRTGQSVKALATAGNSELSARHQKKPDAGGM